METKVRYVDLFAGIGGFAAAFSAFGAVPEYSVEIDPKAAMIYEKNWGHNPLGDITQDANDARMCVGDHDILAAGFPCQPFSKSGAQKGMEETRGTLYWNILQILKERKPALVLLENVRNLAGPRHIHEWQVIIETLREAGYRVSSQPTVVSPHQLPPSRGGRPQIRERVFITATYVGTENPEDLVADPIVSREELKVLSQSHQWDLRRDLPLVSGQQPHLELTEDETLWISAWDEWVRIFRSKTGQNPPGFPIWVDSWLPPKDRRITASIPKWKADFLQKNWLLYDEHRTEFDSWIEKWGVNTPKFPPSRRKLEWQAQDSESLWDCLMHFRPSGIRAKKPTYVPALVAITQTSIFGPERRRISVREAARLQGLPDWFDFGDQGDAASYKQLGNGVNVGVVWNVLQWHISRDSSFLAATEPGRRILKLMDQAQPSPDEALKNLQSRAEL